MMGKLFVFRENLAQIIQAGQRVIDNPVYISDLGNYASFFDPCDLFVHVPLDN